MPGFRCAIGTNAACKDVTGHILKGEKLPSARSDGVGRDFGVWFDNDKVMAGDRFLI